MKKTLWIVFCSLFLTLVQNAQAQGDNLSPQRKQAVDSLAMEKVKDLSKYISLIGNKSTPASEAARVMDRAEELFMEGAIIQVSQLGSKRIRDYKVREYLVHLMTLNYDRVNIEWFNIQYVSDLQKQPDGRYVGIITIYQKFEGVTKEGLKYVDTTKKDITIYVERKKTQIGGREVGFWDVLLGDIRVKQTTR